MDKLVSFSTINIELEEKEPQGVSNISSDFGEKIKDSFVRSINFVVKGTQELILGIIELSMPLAIACVVGFPVYKVIKTFIRKRREKGTKKDE